jgi:REP element-mobilizing transposase RayT
MPRVARQKSQSKIYHIMLRGINHQNIFEDDGDCEKFIDILETYRREIGIEIYAYCLMGNHIHLLVKEGKEEFSNTMRRIGASYVYWYNWQYNRKGHLFQDRYRSEAVEDDTYLLTVLRYIHQNPVKAGLAEEIDSYRWSSYNEYTGKERIVDTGLVLGIFNKDPDKAMNSFIEFNKETSESKCLEETGQRKTMSDKEIKELVKNKFDIELATLQNQPPETQKEILKYTKELDGSSLRQLSRLTGFTVNKIFRA